MAEHQLEAYNYWDIDSIISTYSEDIEVYNPRKELAMQGHVGLRTGYEGFFRDIPARKA